jgi:anti-sigma factor RsiW
MNCEQAKRLIQPYADGELDAASILELESHLRECPACAQMRLDLRGLQKAIRQDALFYAAPKQLRQSLAAELCARAGAPPTRKFWSWHWWSAAATGAAVACVVIFLTGDLDRPPAQQLLAQAVVSSHIRSLMANHALDVISTDQHTVKPWFNGKLDFSPPVKDLSAAGFPLIGGRLDYLDSHAVAALVFQRHQHIINLFIWPVHESDAKPFAVAPIQGYHSIHWSAAGMTFWAVSDLNQKELMEFVQTFESGSN